MTIYIDLLLLSNFLLDYSLIAYTGIINQEKTNYLRFILASLFGLIGLGLFYIQIKWLFLFLRFIFSIGIIFIAFSNTSLRQFLKNFLIFYFLNYLTAGILVSFDFYFTDNFLLINYKNYSTWYILLFSFLFANILTYIYKVIESKNNYFKDNCIKVKFRLLNHDYCVTGFIDTGNRVKSLSDNLPVVFINKKIFDFTVNEEYLIKHNIPFTYIKIHTINSEFLALAFKPETFAIKDKKWVNKKVYLVLFDKENFKEAEFQAILNYELIS